jgi:hypothetical protein
MVLCGIAYFIVLLPFAFAWTIVGTVWFTQVTDSCLPAALTNWVFIMILVASYLYVVIGLVLCAIVSIVYWMWRRGLLQVHLNEPLVEQSSLPLPAALVPRLETYTHVYTGSEEAMCMICYEEFLVNYTQSSRLNTSLPCGHEMHADCLRNWLSVKAACPYCRADVVNMLQV